MLAAGDGEGGAEPVVVMRESLWRRRFGARPSILGEAIQLSGIRRSVVGILPDAFKFPSAGEIWVPLDEAMLAGRANPSGASLTVFGILRDGLEIDGATAELGAYARPEQPRRPCSATTVRALPFTGDDETTHLVMSGLVAVLVLVLLVVASNIASLVFARTWSRSSELAVRTAIGAGRSRIVGQLFVEVAILCGVASLIGLGLAQVALRYLRDLFVDVPFWMTFDPTLRTMVFVVALAGVISVVSGLTPVLKATRTNLVSALHSTGPTDAPEAAHVTGAREADGAIGPRACVFSSWPERSMRSPKEAEDMSAVDRSSFTITSVRTLPDGRPPGDGDEHAVRTRT